MKFNPNGSMNDKSLTKRLLENISLRLQNNGASTTLVDLQQLNVPIFTPAMEPPLAIQSLSDKLNLADGIVVGSPEYHGSFTGALKNVLDFLSSHEFADKPIALVTVTGGLKAGTNTLNHLRLVFRNLHGNVIPQQFAISQKETSSHLDMDDTTDLRLEKFVQGLEVEVKKQLLLKEAEQTDYS